MAVPDGYDRDRLYETWRETHGWSPEALRRKAKRDRSRQRNRRVALHEKINWDSYQHHELYDMIMSAQPRAMAAQSDQWRELAGKIERTTSDAQRALTALMNTWRGTAAVAAAASTTRLMRWAGDASHTATRIAAGLADYTDAVSTAQHRMPEPGFADAERNFRAGHTVVGTGGPSTALLIGQLLSDHMVSHKEAADRKAEAVDVMNSYESDSKTVHNGLPDFEPVRPTTNPNLPTDDSTGGPPGHPGPRPIPPPVRPPGMPGDLDGDGIADGTTPGGYSSPDPGSGHGTTAGPPSGGGPGAAAGGGASSGANPLAARGGAGAGGVAGVAGLGGARGAGGMGGAGGGFYPPMGAGAGAQREGDGEHTNKYDEGLDLFDDLPPAYPPVFGA